MFVGLVMISRCSVHACIIAHAHHHIVRIHACSCMFCTVHIGGEGIADGRQRPVEVPTASEGASGENRTTPATDEYVMHIHVHVHVCCTVLMDIHLHVHVCIHLYALPTCTCLDMCSVRAGCVVYPNNHPPPLPLPPRTKKKSKV